MNESNGSARRKAAMLAALLLLAGGLSGVLVDRFWLLPRGDDTMPLTAHAMAARLDLDASQEARVRLLLDSMHTDVIAAARYGPDSLASAARTAHARLEAALPPHSRAEFRAWLVDHHHQLLERLDQAGTHEPHSNGAGH